MNCTKVFPPSTFFVDFGYHYSNFLIFITLLITPLQFYIILTKSQNLKSFKWLILNHSVWSLLFEITWALAKPIVIPPVLAMYPIGVIRYTNYYVYEFVNATASGFAIMYIASLTATLINRYLLTFRKNFPKFLTQKYVISYYIIFIVLFFGFLIQRLFVLMTFDLSYFYQAAIDYDPCLQYFITKEPAFIFSLETNFSDYVLLTDLIVLSFIITMALLIGIFFIHFIKSQKSQTLEKLQRSLLISVIVQLSLSVFFFLLPILILFGIIYFKIPYTGNALIIVCGFIITHSIFESLATLYFVTPYRKGVKEIFSKLVSYFGKQLSQPVVISPITQTETSLNFSRVVIRHS